MEDVEQDRSGTVEADRPIAASLRAGNTIYLAGQIADTADGIVQAPDDVIAQAAIIFEKIRDILAAEGASFTDVVKLVTYFAVPLDVEVSRKYWEVRRRFFGDHKVASTGIQVAALIYPECLIEIEATAVVA
ncbi:RidA family protein [Saccharopolyspora pogona]|uniref:RidA family protein n=1 Tax=Saccharopolyspora pogona TaxID=333966 RepID=UPI001685B25A|nr:RidA family protein [Saccharopolyspora pogona]